MAGETICFSGVLGKGVECPTITNNKGKYYTLAGNLGAFKDGDAVTVCGVIAEFSICMQGQTIGIQSIQADVKTASDVELVYSVIEVSLTLEKMLPPNLIIDACGSVRSGGWTDPELVPVVYIIEPPDGIYDFTFTAKPPTGPATQGFQNIDAQLKISPLPESWHGIRVHSATNSIEKKL